MPDVSAASHERIPTNRSQTIFLSHRAEIPELNPEVALAMLEAIDLNPELLPYLQQLLQQQPE